jgi:SAM-dependent methyltransferase
VHKTAIRVCPVCEESAVELLHHQQFAKRDSYAAPDGYDVVCCTFCGMVYADTASPQSTYDCFYSAESKYQDNKTSTGAGDSSWDSVRLQETARAIASVVPDKSASIVDIGCANGGLLEALRTLGYMNLAGIDPAPVCAANTGNRGFRAWTGSLSAVPEDFPTFDVAVLCHVLEHVRDLQPALAGLKRLMHQRSALYVEVPDAARYCEFLNAPYQDFNTEHINHFSRTCLNNLMLHNGFKQVQAPVAKVIHSSEDTLYPAVFGVYSPAPSHQADLPKDEFLKAKVITYIAASQALMNSMNDHLRSELRTCSEVILWGTGQLALKLMTEEPLRSARIRACVDANPVNRGKNLRCVSILSPSELKDVQCPIVITSTLHETAIRRDIENLGFLNRLVSLRVPSSVMGGLQ